MNRPRKGKTSRKASNKTMPTKPNEPSNSDQDSTDKLLEHTSNRTVFEYDEKVFAYLDLFYLSGYNVGDEMNVFFKHLDFHAPQTKFLDEKLTHFLYEKCFEKRKLVLSEAKKLCLSCECYNEESDIPFSVYHIVNIFSVTAHFVDNDFKCHKILLHYHQFKDYEGEITDNVFVMQDLLSHVIEEWDLQNKIGAIVFKKNCSVPRNSIEYDGSIDFINCFVTSFNGIMVKALAPITYLVKNINRIVEFFKDGCNDLSNYQKNKNQTVIIKPKRAIEGNWCSYIPSFTRIVSLKDIIVPVMQMDEFQNEMEEGEMTCLTDECFILLNQLVEILTPFEEVAMSLSEQGYLKAGDVIVIVRGLNFVCKQFAKNNYLPVVHEIVNTINNELKEFESIENNKPLAICTILDPRYKEFGFSNKICAKNAVRLVEKLVEKVIARNNMTENADKSGRVEQKKLSIWACLETAENSESLMTNIAIREVELYLKRDILKRNEEPLQWWKENAKIYPNLSEVVKSHLCYVASSVACKFIFRKADIMKYNLRSYDDYKKPFLFYNITMEEIRKWSKETEITF